MVAERVKLTIYVDPELKDDIGECREVLHEMEGSKCSLQRFGEIALQMLRDQILNTNGRSYFRGALPSRKPIKPKRK